jgi:hypothetical protein
MLKSSHFCKRGCATHAELLFTPPSHFPLPPPETLRAVSRCGERTHPANTQPNNQDRERKNDDSCYARRLRTRTAGVEDRSGSRLTL